MRKSDAVIVTAIGTLDDVLAAHAEQLGGDFTAYRNHTYRVANLCLALSSGQPERIEKIAVAAAFHDLGIWTAGTFDYLQPSARLAGAHLVRAGRADWGDETAAMILQHHKLTPLRGDAPSLAESFRRADWIDVTRGLRRFGLPRAYVRQVFAMWPNAGFHKRLLELFLRRLRTHPWSPLPMLRF